MTIEENKFAPKKIITIFVKNKPIKTNKMKHSKNSLKVGEKYLAGICKFSLSSFVISSTF